MDSILTNEERAALDLEEERRKKAFAKEMEKAVAYYLMIKFEKIKLEKSLKLQKELYDSLFGGLKLKEKKEFPKHLLNMVAAVEIADRSLSKMHSFFKVDLSLTENQKLKEDMEAADVSEDQFETLAFCACGEDMNKLADEFDKQSRENLIKESGGSAKAPRKHDVSELDKIRDQGILSAKNAIAQYRNGDPKLYSKILGDALLITFTAFAKEPSDDIAMQWSLYTNEILTQFHLKKELVKHCGLTQKHFELAEKVSLMGATLKRGLKLTEKIGSVKLNDKGKLANPDIVYEIKLDIMKFKSIAETRGELLEELYKIQYQPKEKVLC